MEPEAVRLMRAIKERYPDVEAGDFVDPFIAAAQASSADLDPNAPMFRVALHELLEDEVLRHSDGPRAPLRVDQGNEPTVRGHARRRAADHRELVAYSSNLR